MAGSQTNLEEENEAHDREGSELQGIPEAENARRDTHLSSSTTAIDQRQRNAVQRFWKQQVVATVSHDQCRDHFGMNTPVS